MTYRLCLPFLAAIALGVVLLGVKAKHFPDSRRAESEMPVAAPLKTHRPKLGKMLTELAIILAECPCPPEGGDKGWSILVVQEPFLWKDDPESRLRSSLVWILKHQQQEPFENAEVLGVFVTGPPYEWHESLTATIGFDSQRDQYWMALLGGGDALVLKVYAINSQAVVAHSRSSLLDDAAVDWPPQLKPVVIKTDRSQYDIGVGSNCALVTSLTMKVNPVAEGSNLVIQAHSTRDNQHSPVKLWTWQYAIDQNRLSLVEVADVPRPEPVLSERDESNRTRREQWASLVRDIEFRNYHKSKETAGR
ncbi:MAG: hypothetical protein SFV23_01590 [Planctomycetaceae bacterium]|nr:hypothetical protein [Planctomycetaceae bacterium]